MVGWLVILPQKELQQRSYGALLQSPDNLLDFQNYHRVEENFFSIVKSVTPRYFFAHVSEHYDFVGRFSIGFDGAAWKCLFKIYYCMFSCGFYI